MELSDFDGSAHEKIAGEVMGLAHFIPDPCLDTSMALLKRQIPINATPANVFAGVAAQAGLRGW
jgi:hypothetical protein